MDRIIIQGAREHNLKDINLEIPRNKLVVISGVSGSGKSSLAFDTIYAEGRRRYIESLSAYARYFLGQMDKPDLDYIEGLSPAICIEQKTTHRNPRSTVATVTEIYDYLRLLYARIGHAFCPDCGREIKEQSIDQIAEAIEKFPDNSKLMILAPLIRGRKGEHQKVLEDAQKAGYARVRINGELFMLDEEIKLDKNKKHWIDIVVDRIILSDQQRRRLVDSVETALSAADGKLIVVEKTAEAEKEYFFSEQAFCPHCSISLPEMQPRLFSFNSPVGACAECTGIGMIQSFDPELLIPDKSLSFNQGGIKAYNPDANWYRSMFEGLAEHFDFSLDTPLEDLPEEIMQIILYGSQEAVDVNYVNRKGTGQFKFTKAFPGILNDLQRRYKETSSSGIKDWLEAFMKKQTCPSCKGKRLGREALSIKINGHDISEICSYPVRNLLPLIKNLQLSETEKKIARLILKEIIDRLGFMESVGLNYLTLDRMAATLSGGEAQRIRLATQIGSSLTGVLYILDEPTIGLHQRDNQRLIDNLKRLRDIGNTLIVVEHDEQMLLEADQIIDIGPGAGVHGGEIVAQGTPTQIMDNPDSLTGRFLSGKELIAEIGSRRKGNGKQLVLRGASEHNLKNIDVSFPLGCFIVVSGVSGSGKSTLVNDILYPALYNHLGRGHRDCGKHKSLDGLEHIDKVIDIDQSPIGRTPRSNPATYVGVFSKIRDLFAKHPEAKARGYKPGRFSFNVKGGRCEHCQGAGTIKIEMHFLPDVYVRCDVCKGKRFTRETLDIHVKEKNIYDVLEMTVEEALQFFKKYPPIAGKLQTLSDVGLSYIKLGQSAITLSGGEAQRVKLALELAKRSTGKTLYILDEPTTGLHFADVKQLLEVLEKLVDQGNTLVLIEHNLDVIKQADYIIDLGPEGGDEGGTLLACGTPEEIVRHKSSYTGEYLKQVLGHV